jgi:hypothetical protein
MGDVGGRWTDFDIAALHAVLRQIARCIISDKHLAFVGMSYKIYT